MSKVKSLPQQAVRVGKFQEYMAEFNKSLAQKFPHLVFSYHNKFIAPEIRRIRKLERGGLIRIGGLLILGLVDWRIAVGLLFVFWYQFTAEALRVAESIWYKFYILITWEFTNEQIAEEGWDAKWYQGLARTRDDATGFIFHLKPFHLVVRLYDAWGRVRARRRDSEEVPLEPILVEDGDEDNATD